MDHPTGSGKTREMICASCRHSLILRDLCWLLSTSKVLNGYFHDSRPKVPIFPTQAVCRPAATSVRKSTIPLARFCAGTSTPNCCHGLPATETITATSAQAGFKFQTYFSLRAHCWHCRWGFACVRDTSLAVKASQPMERSMPGFAYALHRKGARSVVWECTILNPKSQFPFNLPLSQYHPDITPL